MKVPERVTKEIKHVLIFKLRAVSLSSNNNQNNPAAQLVMISKCKKLLFVKSACKFHWVNQKFRVKY